MQTNQDAYVYINDSQALEFLISIDESNVEHAYKILEDAIRHSYFLWKLFQYKIDSIPEAYSQDKGGSLWHLESFPMEEQLNSSDKLKKNDLNNMISILFPPIFLKSLTQPSDLKFSMEETAILMNQTRSRNAKLSTMKNWIHIYLKEQIGSPLKGKKYSIDQTIMMFLIDDLQNVMSFEDIGFILDFFKNNNLHSLLRRTIFLYLRHSEKQWDFYGIEKQFDRIKNKIEIADTNNFISLIQQIPLMERDIYSLDLQLSDLSKLALDKNLKTNLVNTINELKYRKKSELLNLSHLPDVSDLEKNKIIFEIFKQRHSNLLGWLGHKNDPNKDIRYVMIQEKFDEECNDIIEKYSFELRNPIINLYKMGIESHHIVIRKAANRAVWSDSFIKYAFARNMDNQ